MTAEKSKSTQFSKVYFSPSHFLHSWLQKTSTHSITPITFHHHPSQHVAARKPKKHNYNRSQLIAAEQHHTHHIITISQPAHDSTNQATSEAAPTTTRTR